MKRSYSALIAGAGLVTAILVAVLLPRNCYDVAIAPCLPAYCKDVICSGLGDLSRLGIALGGLAAAAVLMIWRRAALQK